MPFGINIVPLLSSVVKVTLFSLVFIGLLLILLLNISKSNFIFWLRYSLFRANIPEHIIKECYEYIKKKKKAEDLAIDKLEKNEIRNYKQAREIIYLFNKIKKEV